MVSMEETESWLAFLTRFGFVWGGGKGARVAWKAGYRAFLVFFDGLEDFNSR